MTATPTTAPALTERQQQVLDLHNAGKSPTEIGRELGISSQAVHGVFRRLREMGHAAGTGAKPAARSARSERTPRENGGQPFSAASTIAAVQQAITEQRTLLDTREQEIDAEIERLRAEKKEIATARKELEKLAPAAAT